jgi:hypothetical protein
MLGHRHRLARATSIMPARIFAVRVFMVFM